jgi:hypothetical protein
MQDEPDKSALLSGVARFLDEDLRGAVKDPALAFRLRIAANLVRMVAVEGAVEDAHDAAHLAALAELLPEVAGELDELEGGEARREVIRRLERALATRVRTGALDDARLPEARAVVRRLLVQRLSVVNPRFSTREHIE